ncbi:MAG: S1 RNA-binding domain-containing protein, partial [Zetaproteobacteria bacterium]
LGAKAEVPVPIQEWQEAGLALPRVGDEVEAVVVGFGGEAGVRVSVVAAKREEAWEAVEASLTGGEPVIAELIGPQKGGFSVRIGPLVAFMPWSESALHPRRNVEEELRAGPFAVKVLSARRRPRPDIVVSRKAVQAEQQEQARQAFFAETKVGDVVEGVVRRMTDFGAFVELREGVDALLHVSEIAWRRLGHPREALKVGQKVRVKVLELDPEAGRIAVSLRALEPDPWADVPARYQPGMRLAARVLKTFERGVLVEIEPGVEGWIPAEELSWTRKRVRPSEIVAEGELVDAVVLEVRPEERRMLLSYKGARPNPWEVWLSEHPVGSRVKGPVVSKTDFGVFVRVGEELDGLVHMSDLSWTEEPEAALARVQVGDELECVVLGVDVARGRIQLGVKQLEEDPLEVFLKGAQKGGTVRGVVRAVDEAGAQVELAPGVVAFLPRREIPKGRELAEGEELEARLIEADRRRRRVVISVRQHERMQEREALRRLSREGEGALPNPLAEQLKRLLEEGR